MTKEQGDKAVLIIAHTNSPKFSTNVPVTDNYSNVHDILIHCCNADCINKLLAAGYSLFMTEKGLAVDYY